MREVAVTMNVTLDGVLQAPGHPEEDVRDGFPHGGWAVPYADAVQAEVMGQGMGQTSAMLFGRRTYENFVAAWAHRTDGNPFTEFMTTIPKYVATTTLSDPLPWENSRVLPGDAVDAVRGLKREGTGDLAVIGSAALVTSLARAGLVDTYTLLIHPLVLGTGRRLFPDGAPTTRMRLVESVTTSTGVIIASYRSDAGEPEEDEA